MVMILFIPLALITAGLISVGVPVLVTLLIWIRPAWLSLRRAALAGVAGAALGMTAGVALVVLPFLLLRAGQEVMGIQDRPLEPLSGVIMMAAMNGILTGMPALSFLGYLAGFLRHWRQQQTLTLPAA
jgi:hypothetical protein